MLVGDSGRIDDERSAVAEIDEVGRMTEALVDERHDLGHASCALSLRCFLGILLAESPACQVIV